MTDIEAERTQRELEAAIAQLEQNRIAFESEISKIESDFPLEVARWRSEFIAINEQGVADLRKAISSVEADPV